MEVYYLRAAARQPGRADSFAKSNDCFEPESSRSPAASGKRGLRPRRVGGIEQRLHARMRSTQAVDHRLGPVEILAPALKAPILRQVVRHVTQVADLVRQLHHSRLPRPLARRMGTSRSQLDRVLEPAYTAVQLDALIRAASAVGRDLRISLQRLARA